VGPRSATHSVVLDAGALIAIEKGDRKVLALCKVATFDGVSIVVPAGVVGQVWRDGARQVRIARLVAADGTIVEALDLEVAKLAGTYCGRSGTKDVVDATVVVAARQHHAKVVTSDQADLERLDPGVEVIRC
jgi:PIN domain nuclease of toxin-antitoxin system